ncbi:MAG: MFS transporter [Ktedonobacterales bacterium]|nr:MFS transporter [Ktedonobacterales bacterium]
MSSTKSRSGGMRSQVVRPVAPRHTARPRAATRPSTGGLLAPPTQGAARYVFWVLTAINFINYLDRIVFVAVGPQLKLDFHLNDAQVGMTASAFLLIYTLFALPMGLLADRGARTRIIAFGVALWSLATWYTAIAHTFGELFVGRAVLGIGEASYIPAGVALLAAYFPRAQRAQVLSRWGASTLVGTAVGFIAGGVIAQHFGWRLAFFICGPPGLVLAWLIWRAADRQAYDEADRRSASQLRTTQPRVAPGSGWLATLAGQARAVLRSPTVRVSIFLQALGLFVTTPAIVFVPIHLKEHYHLGIQTTALITGAVLIPAGVLGTLLGGAMADRLSQRFAGGRMLAVAIGFGGAVPFIVTGFLSANIFMLLGLSFVGALFMNMYNGPLNAAIQDVVPPALRASALAVIMTIAHLLGDVGSPTLVGAVAGKLASHNVMHALVIFAGPALTLAAILALLAARTYARETTPAGGNVAATRTEPLLGGAAGMVGH